MNDCSCEIEQRAFGIVIIFGKIGEWADGPDSSEEPVCPERKNGFSESLNFERVHRKL